MQVLAKLIRLIKIQLILDTQKIKMNYLAKKNMMKVLLLIKFLSDL